MLVYEKKSLDSGLGFLGFAGLVRFVQRRERATEETLIYQANGSNAKPMAPTCAESAECVCSSQGQILVMTVLYVPIDSGLLLGDFADLVRPCAVTRAGMRGR